MATKVFKNIEKLDYTFEDGEILSADDLTSISDKIDEIIDVLNRDDICNCSCNEDEEETEIWGVYVPDSPTQEPEVD